MADGHNIIYGPSFLSPRINMDFEIFYLIGDNCLWVEGQKLKEEPQKVIHPTACYIDKPSLDPLLCNKSTERYTDITVKLHVPTVN